MNRRGILAAIAALFAGRVKATEECTPETPIIIYLDGERPIVLTAEDIYYGARELQDLARRRHRSQDYR